MIRLGEREGTTFESIFFRNRYKISGYYIHMSKPKKHGTRKKQRGGMGIPPGGIPPPANRDPAQDRPDIIPIDPQPAEQPKQEVPKDDEKLPDDILKQGPATNAANEQEAKEQQEKEEKYKNCQKKCEDEKNQPKKGFFDFSWLFGPPKQAGGKRTRSRKLKHKKGK